MIKNRFMKYCAAVYRSDKCIKAVDDTYYFLIGLVDSDHVEEYSKCYEE